MVLFKYCLGWPLFLFCDKKVPWVLFKNYEIHPPTLWVLLGMCSIKKVSAVEMQNKFSHLPYKATYLNYMPLNGYSNAMLIFIKLCIIK